MLIKTQKVHTNAQRSTSTHHSNACFMSSFVDNRARVIANMARNANIVRAHILPKIHTLIFFFK